MSMSAVKKKKTAKKKSTKKSASKKKRVSFQKQPEGMKLKIWQTELRRQFAEKQTYAIVNVSNVHKVWSDFKLSNPVTKMTYSLGLRGQEPGENYCTCPDFRTNRLGTCKHIEWALHHFQNTYGYKKYFKQKPPEIEHSSLFVNYPKGRLIQMRVGTNHQEDFQTLQGKYFDENNILNALGYSKFEELRQEAKAIDSSFHIHSDVLEMVLEERERQRRLEVVKTIEKKPNLGLGKTGKLQLFPYQKQGVLFALRAGRSLIADEMGLGKTIQAIATAEIMRSEFGIEKVLIICPTSLKYQWKSEIEKFTDSSVKVIEGNPLARAKTYKSDDSFYQILTYHVVARDIKLLNEIGADLVVLDEAQRIKNWNTKISRAVKQVKSPYCVVLTGTPLENRLEELYSIVQFVNPYLLGPVYSFLDKHQVKDPETGQILGYRNLHAANETLKDVMLRRRKKQVLKELPRRQDKILYVPMTEMQMDLHNENKDKVARIVAKWRRFGFLREKDRQTLMICLNLMRMSCNSSYLIDQVSRHDTKIGEVMAILEERLTDPDEKVVIFSQWERMTRLIAAELEGRGIGFAYLHGGVPSSKRGELLDRFRQEKDCLIFLSTDAGGVGLNLQSAGMVINMDIPWNPAVLEQRIARVYRMGQERPVQVVNLISTGTIEHRMLDVLQFKSDLAAGVLDAAEDSIFMDEERHKKFMDSVEEIMEGAEQGKTTEVVIKDTDLEENIPGERDSDNTGDMPETALPEWTEAEETTEALPEEEKEETPSVSSPSSHANNPQQLVQQGVNFFSSLSQTLSDPKATEDLVKSITETDAETGQTYLKVPVESQAVVNNALKLFGALFGGKG